MTKLTRIVAAVVDQRNLTMYKPDGTTIVIPQGDPRLRRLVDAAIPQLAANVLPDGSTWADVEIDPLEDNSYAQLEDQTAGLVRFFRVAKSALKRLIGPKEEPIHTTLEIGTIPVIAGTDDQDEHFDPVQTRQPEKVTQAMDAVNEIIKHAIPATSYDFNEVGIEKQRAIAVDGLTENSHPSDEALDTIIAVVDDKIIPNMERIKTQLTRAAKLGSTVGIEKFLQRLATVVEQRSHSVDDLLKFLERADLPIADDGSILIYKVLRSSNNQGKYVDCHTRKVEQFIGAYVCMDPSLVDHNRNNECSNGLHVARRGYISQFSGDVCVLAKLAPEDVITVPTYDANKMRVCGYHILMELTAKQYTLLRQNRPITDDEEGKRILASAMRGDHVSKLWEVRITGGHGEGVITTELKKDTGPILAPIVEEEAPQEPIRTEEEALGDDPAMQKDVPVNPKSVVEEVAQQLSRKEQAQALYTTFSKTSGNAQAKALDALLAFKKAAKVSWEKLGVPDPSVPVAAKPAVVDIPVAFKIVDYSVDAGSPRERIKKLLEIGLSAEGVAQKIYDIKKASKKSWEALGISDKDSTKVLKKLGKV